jgi:hypothetical protein
VRVSRAFETLVQPPWDAGLKALLASEEAQRHFNRAIFYLQQASHSPANASYRQSLFDAITATAGELAKDARVTRLVKVETLPTLVIAFIQTALSSRGAVNSGFWSRRFWPEQEGVVWLPEGSDNPAVHAPATEIRRLLPYMEWLEAIAKGKKPAAGRGAPKGSGVWSNPDDMRNDLYPLIQSEHQRGRSTTLPAILPNIRQLLVKANKRHRHTDEESLKRLVQRKCKDTLGKEWPQVVEDAIRELG